MAQAMAVAPAAASVSSQQPVAAPKSFQGFRAAPQGVSLRASFAPSSSRAAALNGRRTAVCMSLEAGIGVFGNKAGMTQIFTEAGLAVPVTVIALGEGNVVTQVKTPETDGYSAVQVGYKEVAERKLTRPEIGHLKKSESPPLRYLAEWRLKAVDSFTLGQQLKAEELFKAGDLVDVSGTSIGKGFQGAIKRHNFHRGPMSHGSKSHRELGSTGPGTTPGRVYPGKKEAGQMGNEQVKVRKLEVIRVDSENRCILVKGAVPGKPGNLLRISPAKIVGKNI
eukprot:jgi/Chlat1/696/Chrsp104S01169